jgi:transcriptional regulator with XRE-family HTH domain
MTTSAKARVLNCLVLRGARERAGLTQNEVAAAFGWSVSKLRRFESGETALSPEEVVSLARYYGTDDEHELKAYREAAATARRHGNWSKLGEHLTRPTRDLMELEAQATHISTFQNNLVPGPLQTPALAEVVLRSWRGSLSEEQVKTRLAVRLGRRDRIFGSRRPTYRLILDEAVLHRVLGGPEVFAQQLESLATDIEDGLISVRIAPFEVPAFLNIERHFVLLTLDDEYTVLYLEERLNDEIVLKPETVASYADVFEVVWAKCLREDETYQLLQARTYELLGIAAWKDGGAVKARSSLQPAGADR